MTSWRASMGRGVPPWAAMVFGVAVTLFPAATRAWPVSPSGIEQSASGSEQPAAADGGAAGPPSSPGDTQPPPPATPVVAPPVADVDEPRTPAGRQRASYESVAAPPVPLVPGQILMLDIGLHKPVGDGSDAFHPGLRAGMFVGGRVGQSLSANAELVFDLLNPDLPDGSSVTEFLVDVTFSPLLHAPLTATTQFIVGPRLGIFYLYESASFGTQSFSGWGWGWAPGLNAGFLVSADRARFGALASFGARSPVKVCAESAGGSEMCTTDNLNNLKFVSIALLVML